MQMSKILPKVGSPWQRPRRWFGVAAIALLGAGIFSVVHGMILMIYDDLYEPGHWQAEHFNAWVASLSGNILWWYWLTAIGQYVLFLMTIIFLSVGTYWIRKQNAQN